MSFDPQLRELQLVFIDEAKQFLDDAEETLMTIEASGFTLDLINKAFRLAHNFKGSAHSVGFTALANLAHKYEDILTALKKQLYPLTPALTSALLHCNDVLRQEILILKDNPDHESSVDYELSALDAASQNLHSPAAAPSAHDAAPATAPDWSQGFEIFSDSDDKPKVATPPSFAAVKKSDKAPPPKSATPKNEGDEILKVPAARLDQLLNIIGEMVVNQSILDDCNHQATLGSGTATQAVAYMSKLVHDLQGLSISLRLVPIRPLFQKLRRTARDVASSVGKEINFVDEGDYCELDKSVIDRIADPLNHMIRNAVDHGVDTPAERQAAGKSPVAIISLTAITQDDQVKIIVSDDGRGLNKDKILAKAVSNGLIQAGAEIADDDIYALIFAPGFSTKEQVTDVSGRGVGMEVVQRAVDDLKGNIKIQTALGRGTTFEITLPLSLSIIGGMVVQANGQRFVIPVSQLVETIELNKYSTETITGTGRALSLRGEVIPVYHLSDLLGRGRGRATPRPMASAPQLAHGSSTKNAKGDATLVTRPAVIAMHRGKKVTFEVEEIINQQKIVLKRLGPEFEGLPGIVAGAILSNGEPGLVLSLDGLIAGVAA